jgi:hypothetical protein
MAWLVLLISFLLISSLVLFMTGLNFWLFPALFIFKYIVDALLAGSFLRYMGKSFFWPEFLVFSLIYPLYIVWVVFSGLFSGYTWKNRNFL